MPDARFRPIRAGHWPASHSLDFKGVLIYNDFMTKSIPDASINADNGVPIPSGIAGLDTENGLRRTLGNRRLYLSLLRKFAAGQKSTAAGIRAALESGDAKTAEILAHTAKGLAGNIGAAEVRELARELEHAISGRQPREIIEARLEAFSRPTEALVIAIARALESSAEKPGSLLSAAGAGVEVDIERLRAVCVRLRALLAEDDSEACEVFEENAALLEAAFPERFPDIEDAVRSFNFEAALAALDGAAAGSVLKENA